MPLSAGERIGPYEILGPLGAGGMGEVYRARDTKLGRDVALKVLPEAFAKDAEHMARFQREAQVLASLNHPNIAAIYGLEESGGVRALVMELVEGRTLSERIGVGAHGARPGVERTEGERRSPLPLDEALHIAKQIAEAVESAHERGITHRDLKPANVKITPAGMVKVLDFGLAKALDPAVAAMSSSPTPGTPPLQDSPTLSMAATQAGMILGTAAYMSPEQARGKPVDRRADIWAFGCVLYEMLTGVRVFEGETVSDTLAAVIRAEPEWDSLPLTTPIAVQRLIRRCLTKDPKLRLQAIGEARIAIEETLSGAPDVGAGFKPAPTARTWRRVIPWSLAVLAVVSSGFALWSLLRVPLPQTQSVTRLAVTLPPTDRLALGSTPVLALSPDGSRLVYVAYRSGTKQLYVRPIDRLEATPIPGTEGAESPFFSPDGQSLGFFAEGKLKKVSLSGGAPFAVCIAASNRGASWGPDDSIIFSPSAPSGLFQIPVGGGTPKVLTVPDHTKGEYSHRWPEILPGGRAALLTAWTGASSDEARIDVLSLEMGERRVLIQGGAYARYVPTGHLVYARASGLLAVPFDLKRLEVTGPPVSILEGVSTDPDIGEAEFSFSNDGSLAYVPGGSRLDERFLVWVDRDGAAQPLPTPRRGYITPRLSPTGRRLAVGIEGGNSGLWLYELSRGTLTRLTPSAPLPYPIWTPDDKRVTFRAALSGPMNLYWMPADGSGAAERLTTSGNFQYADSWSPDGQVLAFSEADPTTGWDIWVLKLEGDPSTSLGAGRKPQPFLQTPSNESGAIFSPDGRWLAYVSDETGRDEVYVRPFPGPGGKWQISTDGGTEPVWARSGRELFYRNSDKMMAATVATKPAFAAAKPKLLFEGQYETASYRFLPNYDVSSDGQRFLMIKTSEQGSASTQINIVLNWLEDLKRRVPTGEK